MSDEDGVTLPDFDEWAKRVMYNLIPIKGVSAALKEAFDQGRSLGLRGAEEEWWREQDSALLDKMENETEEELSELFEKASLTDFAKFEEEQDKIIASDKTVHEKLIDLSDLARYYHDKND